VSQPFWLLRAGKREEQGEKRKRRAKREQKEEQKGNHYEY